jgi:hypothetical protein
MAAKWPPKVQGAIREAFARGERHSVAFAKLKAGTLPGLDGEPVAMPPRSFTYQWTRARREQQRGQTASYAGPSMLQYLAVMIARQPRDSVYEHRLGIDDPELLAEAIGLGPELVKECFAIAAKEEAGGPRWCDQIAEALEAAGLSE